MENIQKLEQFGFTIPSSADEQLQARIQQYFKLISAQYEQTKDVLWCVLDQPVLPNGVKLEPADAFHAVVSEIHGLLVQTSQVHRTFSSQYFDQKQISETLSQQIDQLKKIDPSEQQKQQFLTQIDQIKTVYVNEVESLKKQLQQLQIQLQQQIKLSTELEKQNLLLKADSRTLQQTQSDDLTTKRVIYQRDLLETQIQQLQIQKQEFDAQQLQYQQLLELTKTELFQKGIEQHVINQIQQTTGALTRACVDIEQLKGENEQLKGENQKLKKMYENEKIAWMNEKQDLKRGWQEIYDQLAGQLM
uniref:Uncharacterized protein n=1 Tax=Trepomonas sp. PC1 TaxID=1076344 RepID=A0A146K5H0_9EUKA|eukprot:JAP92150.1 Hypothetical protein TPC1_15999 [Trepomonas sp. PC1]